EALLERSLYARTPIEELSEQQAADTIAAAQRRIDRVEQKLERQRKLIEEGVMARGEMGGLESDLQVRRTALDQAKTRAALVHEIVEIARLEAEIELHARDTAPPKEWKASEWVDGASGLLGGPALKSLTLAYEKEFSKPLRITARGSTA